MRYSRFDKVVIVSFGCLVFVALGAFVILNPYKGVTKQRAMAVSVEYALKRTYDQATGFTNKFAPERPLSLEPTRLQKLEFFDPDGRNSIFPSFVAGTNVFLASETVHIPSLEFVCVVQMPDGGLRGIDGNGHCLEVSAEQFNKWHHRGLPDVISSGNSKHR